MKPTSDDNHAPAKVQTPNDASSKLPSRVSSSEWIEDFNARVNSERAFIKPVSKIEVTYDLPREIENPERSGQIMITCQNGYIYEIGLHEFTNEAALLQWLLHLSIKPWMNKAHLWATVKATYPQWTPEQCERLEKDVPSAQVTQWYCRVTPLPADRWLLVEFRTWQNPRWRLVPAEVLCTMSDAPDLLGVRLEGVAYYSQQQIEPGKPTRYAVQIR